MGGCNNCASIGYAYEMDSIFIIITFVEQGNHFRAHQYILYYSCIGTSMIIWASYSAITCNLYYPVCIMCRLLRRISHGSFDSVKTLFS